jgi:hypothetical protein
LSFEVPDASPCPFKFDSEDDADSKVLWKVCQSDSITLLPYAFLSGSCKGSAASCALVESFSIDDDDDDDDDDNNNDDDAVDLHCRKNDSAPKKIRRDLPFSCHGVN